MAKRQPLVFREEDRKALRRLRYEHPHARVQQRLEVLWLLSQGVSQGEAGRLAGVGRATVARYVGLWRRGGLPAVQEFGGNGSVSALESHRETLAASFREQPPHTIAEACERIKQKTGVARRPTQVRRFFKRAWV